jgi:hypothetical protein
VNPLRRISTPRLLAIAAGAAVIGGGGAAIAATNGGGGPTPPPEPLASAVHDALAAPAVPGITARISFTNHLIDSSSLPSGDPILSGATGRLWLTQSGDLRLELQSSQGDAQVVLSGGHLSVYDAGQNTVYRADLPAETTGSGGAQAHAVPSVDQIAKRISKLMSHADLSGAIPTSVAGQPAYAVRISPRHDGGLVGYAELAWDAAHGVPLRIAIYAAGNPSPVLELIATDISYGPVSESDVKIAPPSTAKVVQLDLPTGRHQAGGPAPTGASGAGKSLTFPLAAPATLVGLPRHTVRVIDWKGSPAALVTYGRGLGGIAVIERAAAGSGGFLSGQGLPSVSINGASGRELDTALGTVVQFTRGGVTYTVLGSIPPMAAEAAARALG